MVLPINFYQSPGLTTRQNAARVNADISLKAWSDSSNFQTQFIQSLVLDTIPICLCSSSSELKSEVSIEPIYQKLVTADTGWSLIDRRSLKLGPVTRFWIFRVLTRRHVSEVQA